MQTGKNVGMQTLDDGIQNLITKKWISPEEAYEKAIDKNRFAKNLNPPRMSCSSQGNGVLRVSEKSRGGREYHVVH
jgi:Tfp pilus assembly ATPase PilU